MNVTKKHLSDRIPTLMHFYQQNRDDEKITISLFPKFASNKSWRNIPLLAGPGPDTQTRG